MDYDSVSVSLSRVSRLHFREAHNSWICDGISRQRRLALWTHQLKVPSTSTYLCVFHMSGIYLFTRNETIEPDPMADERVARTCAVNHRQTEMR